MRINSSLILAKVVVRCSNCISKWMLFEPPSPQRSERTLATKVASTTQGKEYRKETVEEFLARGRQIERIEAHPDADGRVVTRGARDHRSQVSSRPAGSQKRS